MVGSIDLEPVAWHWTWEPWRAADHLAFQKLTGGRHMEGADWAAWVAVKMVVQATLRTRSAEFKQQREFILGGTGFDGWAGGERASQQLRQAVFSPPPTRSPPARRSRAFYIAATCSTRSATTSRKRRAA